MWLGLSAGIAGLEHGFFELRQGNARPPGVMFASIGPPCDPETAWHACEPAMTIIPNYAITGILALALSVAVLIWSAAFLQRRRGGEVLMLLSVALLLFGGGIFPPLIGLVAGATATRINRPLPAGQPGRVTQFAARLWPWPLVVYLGWIIGQFVVGYLANDFLKGVMGFGLLLIFVTLPLSVYTAYARDAMRDAR
jgi:hypothetical protein